jgi:hypothetical protein
MKKSLGIVVAIMAAGILIGTSITVKSVAAGEKARDGRFVANDNGTVLDTKTKLMWADKDNGKTVKWVDANSYCESYRGGGYTDWRMPTVDELVSLYDETKSYTADNGKTVHLTKLIHLTSFVVWTSETSVLTTTNNPPNSATSRIFIFYNGKKPLIRSSNFTDSCALPVRSSK